MSLSFVKPLSLQNSCLHFNFNSLQQKIIRMKSIILKLSLLASVAIALLCPSAAGQSLFDSIRPIVADMFSTRLGCAPYITSYVQNCVVKAFTEILRATSEEQCIKARRDKMDCHVIGFDACGAPADNKKFWTDVYVQEIDEGKCSAKYINKN